MSMKLLLKISYLGTRYAGYQVQPNADTVQRQLNLAAERLFGYPCDIVGCSRTDSGVHAKGFCATVTKQGTDSLETEIPAARIPLAFSANLPQDICVYDACFVPGAFHPRYGVAMKEYLYRIFNRPVRDPFEEGRSCHLPRPLTDDALARMTQAAEHFSTISPPSWRRARKLLTRCARFMRPRSQKQGTPSATASARTDSCITWCGFWRER